MAELWRSALADNGLYFLTAYAIVFGGLGGYVLWLRARLAALEHRESPAGTQSED